MTRLALGQIRIHEAPDAISDLGVATTRFARVHYA
jgi:hypothetical protein